MLKFSTVGRSQSSWTDESKMTIQERTDYHIGKLSTGVVLGEISKDYFEGKIKKIVKMSVEAEREACLQIVKDFVNRCPEMLDGSHKYDPAVVAANIIAERIKQQGE